MDVCAGCLARSRAPRAMMRFVLSTGGLVALLVAALVYGGIFPALAMAYVTLFTWYMDRLGFFADPDGPGGAGSEGDGLAMLLGLVQFPLLIGGVAVICGAGGQSPGNRVLLFLALGLYFGQVANSCAHDLIHRSGRAQRRLGVAVFSSMLFGHHASAHLRVHHVHVATPLDPNSAPAGQSYYAFLMRAWPRSLIAGYRAETALRRRARARGPHPALIHAGWSLATGALVWAVAGGSGIAAWLALSFHAQAQLLLSDYVQHYGLRRRAIAPGRWEPAGPQHSWNAPQGFSGALMLNAPRHSDHHLRPGRAYPALTIDRERMPLLPFSLPVMALAALVPPLWRRLMDRRAEAWRGNGQLPPRPGRV